MNVSGRVKVARSLKMTKNALTRTHLSAGKTRFTIRAREIFVRRKSGRLSGQSKMTQTAGVDVANQSYGDTNTITAGEIAHTLVLNTIEIMDRCAKVAGAVVIADLGLTITRVVAWFEHRCMSVNVDLVDLR